MTVLAIGNLSLMRTEMPTSGTERQRTLGQLIIYLHIGWLYMFNTIPVLCCCLTECQYISRGIQEKRMRSLLILLNHHRNAALIIEYIDIDFYLCRIRQVWILLLFLL